MVTLLSKLRYIILSKFFSLLYHQFAFGYDFVSNFVSLGLWKSWIYSVESYISGAKILEIGHGPGHLLCYLRNKGFWVTGLDESWQMIQQAKINCDKIGQRINSVNGNANFLPFQGNSFDQVVTTFPSNFIIDPLTLSEIHRILIPDGSLVIVPAAWITGKLWVHRLMAWLFKITEQSPVSSEEFTQNWVDIFKESGFFVSYESKNLETSLVFIIIAKKLRQ